ncbi:MAG TPA: glutamate--tRNA ligase family protein [Flavobacteriales bacterium]|nr:glutamate--tRNA ligase family protein [Flavobacteriales bacterium]
MKKTRIAPTPSGFLHAGNAFNFLLTDRLAKATGSKVVLRIDDLDAERTRPEYLEDIFRSLDWLGVTLDVGPSGVEDFRTSWSQQLRLDRYTVLVDELRGKGVLYPCACSRQHFERFTHDTHACRSGSSEVGPTAWRLRIPVPCPIEVKQIAGMTERVDLAASLPDPVIAQRDTGRPAYQIASLSDDLDMGITWIIRGADLLDSTACQLHLAQVLDRPAFGAVLFHHHPLTADAQGQKLSKSAGSTSLKAMREAGGSPGHLIRQAEDYSEALLKHLAP